MYLRGHSNVAVTSLLQLKKEVWLNSNNAFLHTSKWSKWHVSPPRGFLKGSSFTSNKIRGQTRLGRSLLYCKMWLPPAEKRDVQAFLVGWDGGGRRGAMQEKAWSCHLLVPRGKEVPGTAAATIFCTTSDTTVWSRRIQACGPSSCWSLWDFKNNPQA